MKKIKITHKGFTLTQTNEADHHFMITDSQGEVCFHSQCEQELTEHEAVNAIEGFIVMYEKFEIDLDEEV